MAAGRRVHPREDEGGLTTLEWLLIVAAVAGLAALAVVLVTRVVGDTSEQIGGSSARETAARVAATELVDSARRPAEEQPPQARKWQDWVPYYTKKCNQIEITYADAGIETTPNFNNPPGWRLTNDIWDPENFVLRGDVVVEDADGDGEINDESGWMLPVDLPSWENDRATAQCVVH